MVRRAARIHQFRLRFAPVYIRDLLHDALQSSITDTTLPPATEPAGDGILAPFEVPQPWQQPKPILLTDDVVFADTKLHPFEVTSALLLKYLMAESQSVFAETAHSARTGVTHAMNMYPWFDRPMWRSTVDVLTTPRHGRWYRASHQFDNPAPDSIDELQRLHEVCDIVSPSPMETLTRD